MQGKIGLEEHFAIEATLGDSKQFMPEEVWPELCARLLEFQLGIPMVQLADDLA